MRKGGETIHVMNAEQRTVMQFGRSTLPGGRKLGVLMISHVSFLGGAERSLLELATALRVGNYCEPTIACPPGPLSDAATEKGIPVYPLPKLCLFTKSHTLSFIFQFMLSQVALLRYLVASKPDLVHANGLQALLLCIPLARAFRKPCIWHVRDDPANSRIAAYLLGRVDAAIAASHFVANRLSPEGARALSHIHVVPNGVENPTPRPEAVCRAHADFRSLTNGRIVLMVAQIVPWKRHDLFLEAAARLAAEDSNVHFVLAGSNPWSEGKRYLQKLARRAEHPDLCGRVTFLGQRDDAAALIAASDVLVLPSDNEPFGRVIVEAWWLRTPVIVADSGGPADLVKSHFNGIHFKHGNAQSLAEVLKEVLSDDSLANRLVEEGCKSAIGFLSITQVEAIEALYRSTTVPAFLK